MIYPGLMRAPALGQQAGQPRLPAGLDIDLRLAKWPVRDQGLRGTCTSYSLVALREHAASPPGSLVATVRLSEQFLFWSSKKTVFDPIPQSDGTFLRSGAEALATAGVCEDRLWPYQSEVIPSNPSQQDVPMGAPSSTAHENALAYRMRPAILEMASNAAAVLNALRSRCRPVAVALAVFQDPAKSERDNWMSPLGVKYGLVVDPPTGSITRKGHAVCVVGFRSDPSEPRGGWFIVRNSWGPQWASDAPSPGYHSPEPGYGQVSASYVDQYVWEVCAL